MPDLAPSQKMESPGDPPDDVEDLHRKSVHGIATRILSQFARFLLRFGYQVVIARLLVPADFGLVAMMGPVISFIQLFADLGLSQASIQHKSVEQSQFSFLFWVNVAAGCTVALICIAIAPFVAHFYGDQRLVPIMMAAGALLGVTGFGSQHTAILTRQMRFQSLAAIDFANFAFGAAAGLTAAFLGASYWAIIINQAAATFSGVILVWLVSGWVPGKPGSISQMRSMMHFGANFTAFNIVNFFSRNLDNVLIGRFLGENALGLYDRAFKLMLLPFEQISTPFSEVATTLLSKLTEDPKTYLKSYLSMLEAVLLMLYPGLLFMIINSGSLIGLALGPKWLDVVPIFAWLGIDAFVAPIGKSMGWLMVSQARIRELRNWGIVTCILFITCFCVGLRWGVQGVAAGYAAAGLIEICFLTVAITSRGPVSFVDLLKLLGPIFFASAVTVALEIWLRTKIGNNLIGLGTSAIFAYVSFMVPYLLTPRGRALASSLVAKLPASVTAFPKAK